MTVIEYIDTSVPFLKTTDTVEKGLSWMEEYKLVHLPVVSYETNQYLGLVSEAVLLNDEGSQLTLTDVSLSHREDTVKESNHLYDALAVIGETDLDIVPVVNEENELVGLLTARGLLQCFVNNTSANTQGGIIELIMNSVDYSMTEIARIIETNGAKILSSYVMTADGETDKIKLILKLNILDLSLVVAELQHLNYTVVALHSTYEAPDSTNDNYKHLFKYLDL
jgi:acetoin utilization protein AcuB